MSRGGMDFDLRRLIAGSKNTERFIFGSSPPPGTRNPTSQRSEKGVVSSTRADYMPGKA